MNLGHFTIGNIKEHWPKIKARVKELTDQMGDDYESVYASCLYGDSTLLTCPDGFVVVQIKSVPFKPHKDLFVWLASTWDNSSESCFLKSEADLHIIAVESGCKTISFETKRQGFDRILPEGWSKTKVVYQKEIK